MEPSTAAGGYMTAPPPIQTHASIPNQQVYIAKIENTMAAIEEQQLTNDPRYANLGVLRSQLTGSERPTIVEPQTSPSQDQSKLSDTQMEQLKSQIEAYKLIARNAPVPKHLLYKATQKKEGLLPLSYEYPMEIESGEKLPYDLMKVFALHQQQAKRVTTLSPPPGIDPQVILRERENRIQNRIGLRISELEKNFPANVPEHLRVKAEIELRALRLLNLQTHVRNEVLGYLKRDTTIETALNPYAYRRTKRQSLREARVTEKLERQQKMEQERMRRQRHMELLQAILQHGRDFKEFHRNIQVKQSKVKKAVLSYHANSERERKRKEQQKERERLQKLMQEDEEGYRLLLDEKKDKRLVFLLQQTDEYVASLTGLVKQHQAKEKMKKQQEKKDEKQALKQAFQDGDDSSEIHVIVRNTTTGEIIKGEEAPKADEIDAWLEAHPGFEVISRDAASDSEDEHDDDYLQRRLPEPKEDEYEGMDEEQRNKMIIEKARNEEDEYDTKTKNQLESYYATAHRIKEKIVKQHSTLGGGDPNLNLKPYQIKGLEWMVSLYNNNLNGILADEMGLGKTIQTVGLITYLMEVKKVNGPYLIVVPLSTISNWVLEFDKWAPHIVKIIYKGTKDMRKRLDMQVKRGAFNVLLTTYDYVMREKSVLGKIRWKYMIIDEGHRMKNHNCKLTITLNAFFHAQHRILLTGTPLQNKLPELWALLNFLLPSIFSSCGTFDQWFNAPFATTGEKVELNQEETMLIIRRLHKVLRPFLLRRLKKEVESELPEKTEYVIKCEQSALQKILYKHMEKGLLLDSKRKEAATSLNNTMAHLRKLCNHPFLFVNVEQECKAFWKMDVVGGKDLYRVAGKFELLDRILPKLKANGHRILIFSQSTELMHILEDYLYFRQWKYLRLDGSTNADKRAELMHTFNEPGSDIFIFMLSTRAGGLGLNLQAADTVIIFDSDWNPHQDMQAQDRAHRIGQQREVRVLRLITVNSIEEKILAAARFKLNIDEKVIQAGKFDQRTTDAERRRILEEIITKEEDNDEDEIPDDDAVNQMIARSEEEFEMFQNMDIERRRQEAAEYRRKPRLIEADEIPPSLLEASRKFEAKEEEVPDKDLAEKISGDVRRARKKVNYSQDLIDDEEWIRQNLGESGDEDEDERKKNKKGKDKTPGKRGRKKRVIVDEDEEEENDDDGPSEKKKKRSSGEGYQQLEDHLNNMWKQLSEFKKSDGNILCEMFMQLPSKKELPLYYKTISKPIDLSKIKKFIRDGKYLSVEDLTEDIKLMVRNAQDYNEEGSEIYDDSVLINEVWNRLVQMMPFKASSTTPADTPGTSTSTNKARERTPAEGKERTPAKESKESSKEPSKERSIETDK